jgi:hypothetical protein
MEKAKAKAKPPEKATPVFRRGVYSVFDGTMTRTTANIPACSCNNQTPKSKAKYGVCANCGGAILTGDEHRYLASLKRNR